MFLWTWLAAIRAEDQMYTRHLAPRGSQANLSVVSAARSSQETQVLYFPLKNRSQESQWFLNFTFPFWLPCFKLKQQKKKGKLRSNNDIYSKSLNLQFWNLLSFSDQMTKRFIKSHGKELQQRIKTCINLKKCLVMSVKIINLPWNFKLFSK